MRSLHIFCCLVVINIILSFGFSDLEPIHPTTGYWAMKGTLVTHQFPDKVDSLSGQKIFELQDEKGLTLWFGRYIYKDVCMTGNCRMMSLWLFWDGVGNYLSIQLLDGESLTKSDNSEFEADDFEKLDAILSDPNSILKDLKSEDLTINQESSNPFQVDSYSGATKPTLTELVVNDAVYTCHTLWHTVYGSTQTMLVNILNNRISSDYLRLMFESQYPANTLWAIGSIDNCNIYHEEFYPLIMEYIKSDKSLISQKALGYFKPFRLNDKDIQEQLVALIPELSSQKKYDIIWKFVDLGYVYEDVVLLLLGLFQNQDIGVSKLNLIYRLIPPTYIQNNQYIMEILQNLSLHDNRYIRNLTNRLLDRND